jgi:hypothetical protein
MARRKPASTRSASCAPPRTRPGYQGEFGLRLGAGMIDAVTAQRVTCIFLRGLAQ